MRKPGPEDLPDLLDIHACAWRETYAGLLPEDEIARRTAPASRRPGWMALLARDDLRIAHVPGQGFAVHGPQKDAALAAEYPGELWSIYLLQAAQGRGLGRALLAEVAGTGPFTARVLAANLRARAFYAASGGREIAAAPGLVGSTATEELVIAWPEGLRR